MNYRTIAGEQGGFACQNNLHVQMGQQGIQFGQLQSVMIDWGDRSRSINWGDGTANRGSANTVDGSVMKGLIGLLKQLRPYMSPMGKIGSPGLSSGRSAIDFCRAAAIPMSMLQLNGNGIAGWAGPITQGILVGL